MDTQGTQAPSVRLAIDQRTFLAVGRGRQELHAIVTVSMTGTAPSASGAGRDPAGERAAAARSAGGAAPAGPAAPGESAGRTGPAAPAGSAGQTSPAVPTGSARNAVTAARAGSVVSAASAGHPAIASAPASAVPTGPHGSAAPVPARLAEVLVLDCSSSMDWPERKFREARKAALAALDALPDGTPFAVVRGTHTAEVAYPPGGGMRAAGAAARREAALAIGELEAHGGTCVGNWLELAGRLLAEQGAAIPHVLMLTDGRNEHDEENPLAAVLDALEGKFVCDAWGIGDGWDAQVLMDATGRLHGSANSVHEERELPAAYRRLVAGLAQRTVPELEIVVTPMPGTQVRYLRQVHPNEAQLPQAPGTGAAVFTTRAWGDERRRYQLCLLVDPQGRPLGEDLQAATVRVRVPGGPPVALPPELPCLVQWTDDPVRAEAENRRNLERAHVEKHQLLGRTAASAADAFRRDRHDPAVLDHLAAAVRLAHELGAVRQLAELQRIVAVHDAAAGRVELRAGVTAAHFEHLLTASTHTTFGPPADGTQAAAAAQELRDCPHCGARMPRQSVFCPTCGRRTQTP